MACQNIEGGMDDQTSAVTLRPYTPIEIEPIVEPEPIPEPIVEPEPEPIVYLPDLSYENGAIIYSSPDCTGDAWTIFPLASGQPREISTFDIETQLGYYVRGNIYSAQVPIDYKLTLWEANFYGESVELYGSITEGLRVFTPTCHTINHPQGGQMPTAFRYEYDPIITIDPIIEPEPIVENLYSYENAAILYQFADCQGESWYVYPLASGLPRDISYWDLKAELGNVNDNVQSVQVPDNWQLTLWEHNFHGIQEVFQGYEVNSGWYMTSACQNVANRGMPTALTYEYYYTDDIIEPEVPGENFPELSSENGAILYSDPGCTGDSYIVFPLASLEARHISYANFEALLGYGVNDNIASVQIPEGYQLTLWENDFYGASEVYQGYIQEGLRVWTWGCHDVGGIKDMASSLTYEQTPITVDPIIEEPVYEAAPVDDYTSLVYENPAILYKEPGCTGSRYYIYPLAYGGERWMDSFDMEEEMGWSILDNISSLQLPVGYQIQLYDDSYQVIAVYDGFTAYWGMGCQDAGDVQDIVSSISYLQTS